MKLNTDSAYWTFKHRSFAYTIFYIIQGPADTLNKKGSAREGHRREEWNEAEQRCRADEEFTVACKVCGWIQPSKAELLISRTLEQELHNLCTNAAANVQTRCVVTANTSGKSQNVRRRAALMMHAGRNHSLMKSNELWEWNYSAPWKKRQSGSCR